MQHSVTSRYSNVLHRSSPTRVAAASAPPPPQIGSHLKGLEALEVSQDLAEVLEGGFPGHLVDLVNETLMNRMKILLTRQKKI